MADTRDREEAIARAREFLAYLKEQQIVVARAFLFGSYAKGVFDESSDIDVAVIAENWDTDMFDARVRLMRAAYDIDKRIEPHPFREEDFDESNPYTREIMNSGQELL